MSQSTEDVASARAAAISHVMRTEAAFENKPNHMRHVENQINYTDAQCTATEQRVKAWVSSEVPKMVQLALKDPKNHATIEAKVDEKSLSEAKRKITDMIKSIFH